MKKTLSHLAIISLLVVSLAQCSASVAGASTVSSHVANLVTSLAHQSVCGHQPAGFATCNAFVRSAASLGEYPLPGNAAPAATVGDNGAYSPAFLQSAYDVPALAAQGNGGHGEIVAIVDAYSNPNLITDLNYYRTYFKLPTCNLGVVSPANYGCVIEQVNQAGDTSPLPATNPGWALEEAIDVESVSAVCPYCQILMVEANSQSMSDLGASVNTAVLLGANVVSNSYGSTEFASETTLANQDFNHPGVTLVAAAGDEGYGVQFPAAAPNVVAVGGTTLIQNSDNGTRDGSETAWAYSGSGCSQYEPKPSWQTDTDCAHRSVDDIAAVADPNDGVWIYDNFVASGLYVAGGTSVATAVVAGLFGVAAGSTPVQNAVENLYTHASALYQVTQGSNGSCGNYLCNANLSVNGYNGPTGLGTPGGTNSSFAALAVANQKTTSSIATTVFTTASSSTKSTAGNGVAATTSGKSGKAALAKAAAVKKAAKKAAAKKAAKAAAKKAA